MNMIRKVLLACLIFPSVVLADNLPDEVISVATRKPSLLSELPVSAARIDKELVDLVAHQHVEQLLNRVPGVNLQRGSGQEYLPAIRSPVLTGAGACGGVLVLEDNIPVRAAGFCNINELFDAHTEQADAIEVIKGPGTVAYGSNAVHGVIDVKLLPFDAGSSVALEYGSYDFARFKLRTANQQQGVKFSSVHDGGWRHDAGVDQHKLAAFRQWENGRWMATTGVSLSHLEQETAGYITGKGSYRSETQARSNLNPEAFRDVQSARLWTRISPTDSMRPWELTPYVRWNQMDFLQHFLPGKPLERNSQRAVGLRYVVGWSDNLDAGFDVEFASGKLSQSQPGPTPGSAFLTETIPAGKHYDYEVDSTQLAGFIDYRKELSDGLALSAGVRAEWIDYDYDNRMLDGRTRDDGTPCGFGGCRYSRPPDQSNDFFNLSPRLGITGDFGAEHHWYASLARGYRAPQTAELYRLQRNQQTADLDPVEISSLEAGVRGGGDKWSYDVSVYYMEKDEVIFRDSQFFNINGGKTKHEGIEARLQWAPLESFDVSLAVNFSSHEYTNNPDPAATPIDGNEIDTAPNRLLFGKLQWTPTADTTVALEWVSTGRYYLESANTRSYPGHDVFHARAGWQLTNDWQLFAVVENLADKRYASRADFTTFTAERYFPGKPRNLQFGIRRSW